MPPEIDIWKQIAAAGLPALLMAVAVWYLHKANQKQGENQDKLIARLDQERGERLDFMEGHIKACDEDRQDLRKELLRVALLHRGDDDAPNDPPTRHHITRPT